MMMIFLLMTMRVILKAVKDQIRLRIYQKKCRIYYQSNVLDLFERVYIDLFIRYRLESKNKNITYDDENEDDDELEQETKIYYASRTHSQLSQFVHEVGKTVYAKDIYEVSLASRKNMCINKEVKGLNNVNKINEACLDLQKKGEQPSDRLTERLKFDLCAIRIKKGALSVSAIIR
jgi:hypothetical protein